MENLERTIRFIGGEDASFVVPTKKASLFLSSSFSSLESVSPKEEELEEELTYVSFVFDGVSYSKETNIELEEPSKLGKIRFVTLPLGINRYRRNLFPQVSYFLDIKKVVSSYYKKKEVKGIDEEAWTTFFIDLYDCFDLDPDYVVLDLSKAEKDLQRKITDLALLIFPLKDLYIFAPAGLGEDLSSLDDETKGLFTFVRDKEGLEPLDLEHVIVTPDVLLDEEPKVEAGNKPSVPKISEEEKKKKVKFSLLTNIIFDGVFLVLSFAASLVFLLSNHEEENMVIRALCAIMVFVFLIMSMITQGYLLYDTRKSKPDSYKKDPFLLATVLASMGLSLIMGIVFHFVGSSKGVTMPLLLLFTLPFYLYPIASFAFLFLRDFLLNKKEGK